MIYTGIGSRETPRAIQQVMTSIADVMAKEGWVLRSGGAPGADIAFEQGADHAGGQKEIFLPWGSFNSEERGGLSTNGVIVGIDDDALALAERYHPRFSYLKQGGKKLMARNSYQVLGRDLKSPTDLVICWTKGGKAGGGTGQAIRIAIDYDIPVIDLGAYDDPNDGIEAVADIFELLTITH